MTIAQAIELRAPRARLQLLPSREAFRAYLETADGLTPGWLPPEVVAAMWGIVDAAECRDVRQTPAWADPMIPEYDGPPRRPPGRYEPATAD